MINEALLISEINGLVGLKNSSIPKYSIVSTLNQTSDSGQYFNVGYPLVSIKNMHETQENENITNNQFNTYLQDLQKDALVKLCRKIINDKTKHIIDAVLFPNRQSFENKYTVPTGFVGMKIEPSCNEDILIKITALTASFDGGFALPIYLYNSETGTAIQTQSITCADKEAVRQKVNWSISLNQNRSGGNYYIGYFSSDASGYQPYKRDYDNANTEHNYFNAEYAVWDETANRISVSSDTAIEEPYGLNIEYTVYKDFTNKLIQNKYMLVEALRLQFAELMVDQILNSTRSSIDERILKEARNIANYNLDGSPSSIRVRLEKEVKSIRKALWPEYKILSGTLR